jgi:hypothetical protein
LGKRELKIIFILHTGTRRELDKTKTELEETRAGLSKTVENLSAKIIGIFGFLSKSFKDPNAKYLSNEFRD